MINPNKNSEPLDLSYLKDMSGDSAEFIIEMIDMFKTQTPLYIADLAQAVNEQNWSKVADYAHKIKPTFAYIGREDAKEHMQMMEHNARELKDVDMLPAAFKEIEDFVQVLYIKLDEARAEESKRL